MLVAGGTDLLPNMKRKLFTPKHVIGIAHLPELNYVRPNGAGWHIGAGTPLETLEYDSALGAAYPALVKAVASISTPQLRNMGTVGGNLCLDTRCNYYNQSYEWRKSIGFCMKKDGDICWVATSSPRCLAVSSSDTAPALIALGAPRSAREIPLSALYQNDGIHYLTRRPDEILTSIHLRSMRGWRSTYWKL